MAWGLGLLATLYGCSSDGGKHAADPLIDALAEPAGAHCTYGGVRIARGADTNGDGVLAETEMTSTDYVCNGSSSTLASTETLASGDARCAAGGMVIHRGADANGNGVLDASEISANEYVCNQMLAGDSGACVFPARWDAATTSCINATDWSNHQLAGESLASSYLAGVDLSNSDLSGANLSWAELHGSNLSGATLTQANLSNASLDAANLTNAKLDGANLSGVQLRGATLTGVSATGLAGCPAGLPQGWTCLDLGTTGRTLFGPDSLIDGLDLSGANLSQTDLQGIQAIHLSGCPAQLPPSWSCVDLGGSVGKTLVGPGANLSGLDLSGTTFSASISLRGVSFDGATLSGATFAASVDLREANFSSANLNGATFGDNSNLRGADFSQATLTLVDFGSDANLTDVQFKGANLGSATLDAARLEGAQMQGATLSGLAARQLDSCPATLPNGWDCLRGVLIGPAANLPGVNLSGADLRDVDLHGATLTGSDLTNVNLSNVNISQVNFTNADLTDANLNGVTATGTIWSNTTCPNGSSSNSSGNTCL